MENMASRQTRVYRARPQGAAAAARRADTGRYVVRKTEGATGGKRDEPTPKLPPLKLTKTH